MVNRTLVLGAFLTLAVSAPAQLVFGSRFPSATSSGLSGAFYLDLASGSATQLWIGVNNRRPNGLAADDVSSTMWAVDSARLLRWNYGTRGVSPIQHNGLYRRGSDNATYATGVDDIAIANGKIYAYTNFSAGSGNIVEDGIYEVDTTIITAVPNMTLRWRHDDLAYNLQGIAYNSADGKFWAANSPASGTTSTAGIYTIDVFGNGAITKVMDFSSYVPNADGIVFGGGYLWTSGKASGDTELRIAGYNLTTQTWDQFFALGGMNTTAYGTGLTWANVNPVPEPGTMAALALGVAALLKRRRK